CTSLTIPPAASRFPCTFMEAPAAPSGSATCPRQNRSMDRRHFYEIMNGEGTFDYEIYLNTKALLSCQKDFDAFCNGDELQFQIVHQVEELWMKLIGYTLLDIDDYLQQENTNRVVSLFRRVHTAQRLMSQ